MMFVTISVLFVHIWVTFYICSAFQIYLAVQLSPQPTETCIYSPMLIVSCCGLVGCRKIGSYTVHILWKNCSKGNEIFTRFHNMIFAERHALLILFFIYKRAVRCLVGRKILVSGFAIFPSLLSLVRL